MKIEITEEMKAEALRKKQEAEALANSIAVDPDDPENPVCLGCI